MAGNFKINTVTQPGVTKIVTHDSRGREVVISTTAAAVADPYQRSLLREYKRNGVLAFSET